MIFVTVGTHVGGFDRLVRAADEMAAHVNEKVLIQRGSSTYLPAHADSFKWTTVYEIESMMRASRVIVSQASAETVIQALKTGRPIVLVPRLQQFGENVNDHQRQLADALQAQGRVIALYHVTGHSLREAIERADKLILLGGSPSELVAALKSRLEVWESEKSVR